VRGSSLTEQTRGGDTDPTGRVAFVPAESQLVLKALAKATSGKKINTVPLKEVEPLTGYIRGGVTALARKRAYPEYMDEPTQLFDVISISLGPRGLQVLIAPDGYIRAMDAEVIPIAKDRAWPER
jgi:Cys-tRNA(Pro)/Cys-tRNA(Cys) deacylase